MSSEMHSRWFHRPTFHVSPASGHRNVSWLEIFAALAFASSWIYTASLADLGRPSLRILLAAAALIPLWWAWVSFSFLQNRFLLDDLPNRLIIAAEMIALGAAVLALPEVFQGSWLEFALSFGALRGLQALRVFRIWYQAPETRAMTARLGAGLGVIASIWVAFAFLPAPWWGLLWLLSAGLEVGVPVGKRFRALHAEYHPDLIHRAHQYALMVAVNLGLVALWACAPIESFAWLTDHSAQVCAALGIFLGVWWMYFDDVAGSSLKSLRLASSVWVYCHMPLAVALSFLGPALRVVLLDGFSDPSSMRWILSIVLVGLLLSIAGIDAVTGRPESPMNDRMRILARMGSACGALLVGVVGWMIPIPAWLVVLALLCIAQVALDLWLVPEVQEEAEHMQGVRAQYNAMRRMGSGDTSEDPEEDAEGSKTVKISARDRGVRRMRAVQRTGAPSELRRDLYFHFMRASWGQVFAGVVLLFILVNLVFAALYLVEPWSVSGVDPSSFWDAFFFSVQTLSTIGYGAMVPATAYGHVIVTVEAGFGMVLVALVTGFVYAKATRPGASVLFSEVAVITQFEGKPTLMIRVGNARGNEIIEATMSAVALCLRETEEGHSMRRLLDVELVRNTSPIFSMSWTVMHVIDEDSPLYGVTQENAQERLDFVLFTLTGHDDTYAQMIHTRQYYEPEHIEWGRDFVDVMTHSPEGRVLIDYRAFHDTRPSGEGGGQDGGESEMLEVDVLEPDVVESEEG